MEPFVLHCYAGQPEHSSRSGSHLRYFFGPNPPCIAFSLRLHTGILLDLCAKHTFPRKMTIRVSQLIYILYSVLRKNQQFFRSQQIYRRIGQ